MKRHSILVDDLYKAVLPRLAELQLPENVHFTDEGTSFLGSKVADSIHRALPRRRQDIGVTRIP